MCFEQTSKITTTTTTTTTTKQKSKHEKPCQNRESNQEPLAPQSDALPLDSTEHKDVNNSVQKIPT